MRSFIVSAGMLMYRKVNGCIEYYLAHCAGPYFANTKRSWSIPKGMLNEGEENFECAMREFVEETGFNDLEYKNIIELEWVYKRTTNIPVKIYAFEGDVGNRELKSNTFILNYDGISIEIPENDKGQYFKYADAKKIIFEYQIQLLDQMERLNLKGLL